MFGIAAGLVALELAVAARYGFHRDELYFLACARHLAWGYVDQPPFVPVVARLATALFGASVVGLRVFPALAGGAAVVFTALMARELGGGRKAQVLAALAAATSPQVLAGFHLLSTAAFDLFFWSAITLLVVRVLRTGDERLWVAVGAVAGVGLLNKFNVAFLLVGLAGGLLLGGRGRVLRSVWLWAGAGLAFAIWSPNLIWNAQHDWAALAMLRSLHQENSTLGASLAFIPSQFIVVGPVLIVLWFGGLRHLLRHPFARPLGVTYVILLVLFTVTGAKSYYLAGMYFVLFAAGGTWAEGRLDVRRPPRGIRGWVALMTVGAVMALPLALPVLPATALARGAWEGNINKDLSATVGWQSLVDADRQGLGRLAGRGARPSGDLHRGLWGRRCGGPLRPRYGLPHAISGDNSYWWWGPAGARNGSTTIAVDLSQPYLRTIFSEVTPAGTVATPDGVWSEERGDPIWVCRGQKLTWAQAWPGAKHYG